VDGSPKRITSSAQLREALQKRSKFLLWEIYSKIEKEANNGGYMQCIETVFNKTLGVLHCPVVDISQSYFSDVMVAKFNNLDIYEQLCASVYISKALAASINDQAKEGAFGNHTLRRQSHKIGYLCFQETLEGII
jgi:hypothetical protein